MGEMESPHPHYPEVAPIDVVLNLLPDVDRSHVPYFDGSERLRLTHVKLDTIRGLGDLKLVGVEDDPRILSSIEDGSLPPLLVYKDGSTYHVPYNEGWRQAAVAKQHGIVELPAYLFDPEEHATTPDVRTANGIVDFGLSQLPDDDDARDDEFLNGHRPIKQERLQPAGGAPFTRGEPVEVKLRSRDWDQPHVGEDAWVPATYIRQYQSPRGTIIHQVFIAPTPHLGDGWNEIPGKVDRVLEVRPATQAYIPDAPPEHWAKVASERRYLTPKGTVWYVGDSFVNELGELYYELQIGEGTPDHGQVAAERLESLIASGQLKPVPEIEPLAVSVDDDGTELGGEAVEQDAIPPLSDAWQERLKGVRKRQGHWKEVR
jgi:hypothetical protein